MSEAIANARASTQPQLGQQVSLNPGLVAVGCAALLYAFSWIMGCGSPASSTQNHAGGKKAIASRQQIPLAPEDVNDKAVATNSGRRLTIEKMAQRAATSLQFSNEEYGIAFDAPKGYLLKEGELPDM